MTVTFFTNYLNHHQVWVADELFNLLGEDFKFVATRLPNRYELKGGGDFSDRPYLIQIDATPEVQQQIRGLIETSDVCIFGADSQELAKHRKNGLSFEIGERWFKKGFRNIFSPSFLRWFFNYNRYYRHRNYYKLCAGGFVAKDDRMVGCYKNRHFKWGYFTNPSVSSKFDFARHSPVRLMWCGRFIDWKHPEVAINLAIRLRRANKRFKLDMYGTGPLLQPMQIMVEENNLKDCVVLHGYVNNSEIQSAMKTSDIFLLTSDREEGWGAVVNEAMSAGCAVVACKEIGSVPYLIIEDYNGATFTSGNIDELTSEVFSLMVNPDKLANMKRNAQEFIRQVWSPQKAAESLVHLIEDLQVGRECSILQGPCSKA